MDRVVRDVAPLNTPTPILVTELGMERVVRDVRLAKALLPMDVTPGAITTAPAHDVPFETTPFVMV